VGDPSTQAAVLVVDDDKELATSVCDWLTTCGYKVQVAHDAASCRAKMEEQTFQVLVLDWMLPDKQGTDICREVREQRIPIEIIMLTGRDGLDDLEKGFQSGTSDYLTKPFAPRELSARIEAILRRSAWDTKKVLEFPRIRIELQSQTVYVDNRKVFLTKNEFKVLSFLASHPEHSFSADSLLSRCWGDSERSTRQSMMTCISRLRSKLQGQYEDSFIVTDADGYRFCS
jgi:DNA-binding response OmpR family regulator